MTLPWEAQARPSSSAQACRSLTRRNLAAALTSSLPCPSPLRSPARSPGESRTFPVWDSLLAALPHPCSQTLPLAASARAPDLQESCSRAVGGASSLPSNAPSNRVTSAPSGPMRAENSCAPASRSEPERGASETGGTDLQEPGLPAELQLLLLPLLRCRHRRCRCQRPSEE